MEQLFVLCEKGFVFGPHRSDELIQVLGFKSKAPAFKNRRLGHPSNRIPMAGPLARDKWATREFKGWPTRPENSRPSQSVGHPPTRDYGCFSNISSCFCKAGGRLSLFFFGR